VVARAYGFGRPPARIAQMFLPGRWRGPVTGQLDRVAISTTAKPSSSAWYTKILRRAFTTDGATIPVNDAATVRFMPGVRARISLRSTCAVTNRRRRRGGHMVWGTRTGYPFRAAMARSSLNRRMRPVELQLDQDFRPASRSDPPPAPLMSGLGQTKETRIHNRYGRSGLGARGKTAESRISNHGVRP
jgi:hypothetical protein